LLPIAIMLLLPWSAAAAPATVTGRQTVDRIMASLADQNAVASATIRDVYREYLELLVIDGYSDLESALGNGGLVPLPPDPRRFNVAPRVAGLHPIGEKDLDNQVSYIAARPATIGCLLDIASRVKDGPVEVTSLVRHSDYQDELRGTNPNAITSIPMHTMGLAFDIALINTPMATVNEILDVLTRMRDAGDILFIGERHQIVFHVVPQPSRLGYFTDVYARAIAAPPTLPGAHPIRFSSMRAPAAPLAASVSTNVIDVRPTDRDAAEWWATVAPGAVDARVNATLRAASGPARPPQRRSSRAPLFPAGMALVLGLVTATWRIFR
jgi:hypothetical protein